MNAPKATGAIDETAALFAQMEPPLQTVLEGLLAGLSGFSDLVAQQSEPGPGEFQGYDGIESRGDVADLLASDWAIYDLDRTEFLRRVAMKEALYRRKSYESDTSDRAMCLVVDSGAWMLGQNRLLALGALFWLGAQAARHGAQFMWCETASPKIWHTGLTREQITGYLQHVAQRELDQPLLDQIVQNLPIRPEIETDFWVIGPAGLEQRVDMTGLRAGVLAGLPYVAQDSESAQSDVTLWSNGALRRTLPVAFATDDLCIGAMRRPFAYQSSEHVVDADHLRTGWAAQHWVETEGHLVIRWPEGLLLLPDFTATGKSCIWVPLPDSAQIIGLKWSGYTVHLLWYRDGNRNPIYHSTLGTLGEGADSKTDAFNVDVSGVDLDFETTALPVQTFGSEGNQNLQDPLYDRRGRAFLLNIATGSIRVLKDAPRLMAKDGSNSLIVRRANNEHVQLTAASRGEKKRYTLALSDPEYTIGQRRHSLIATSDTAVMSSTEGGQYRIWDQTSESDAAFPPNVRPVQMLGPKKGFAYDAGTGMQVQYRLHQSGKPHLSPKTHKGTCKGLVAVRSAAAGRFGYGVGISDGKPETLTLLRFGGKGAGYDTRNIADSIAEARTLWLKD